MVGSNWRRAFCSTIPKDNNIQTKIAVENQKDEDRNSNKSNVSTPKLSSKFGFFSNPSTPRLNLFSPTLRCRKTSSDSPKLYCRVTTPKLSQTSSAPTNPKSPSSFTLLRNTFGFSKTRCGICLQNVKTGQGKAIFTAECSHSFHFPCISAHVRDNSGNTCPVCNAYWSQEPQLTCSPGKPTEKAATENGHHTASKPSDLKLYNDDEPLMSPTSGGRFNPIPESDENDDESCSVRIEETDCRNVDVTLLNDSAVVSASRGSETHAIVLKIRAPARTTSHRAPAVDLVTVIDVSDGMDGNKLRTMRRAMRVVISSLSSRDRLSIVAFSTCSKRLLPFRRMTATGRRSAGKIVDVMRKTSGSGRGMSAGDAVRKAAKVIQDRREKNPVSMIVVLSTSADGQGCRSFFNVSSTRFPHLNIPVNAFGFNEVSPCDNALADGAFKKCLKGLLSVAVQDFRIQLGLYPGSGHAQIVSVYSCTGRPVWVGSGSGQIMIGDLLADEERELLIGMKVPTSGGSRPVMSVQTCFRDPSSSDTIRSKEQAVLVPTAVRSDALSDNIRRLRSIFVTTRAVAESRRLTERNAFSGAQRLLTSARALLVQSGDVSNSEFISGLEAELADVSRRSKMVIPREIRERVTASEEKAEPLTPTSAWRAAEKLAKVAMMRKSLNRVSDLHGFENARF